MARPRMLNVEYGLFQTEVMNRMRAKLENENWLPSKAEMEVVKLLAEVQLLLQKSKEPETEGLKDMPTKRRRREALVALESSEPEAPGQPEVPEAEA